MEFDVRLRWRPAIRNPEGRIAWTRSAPSPTTNPTSSTNPSDTPHAPGDRGGDTAHQDTGSEAGPKLEHGDAAEEYRRTHDHRLGLAALRPRSTRVKRST